MSRSLFNLLSTAACFALAPLLSVAHGAPTVAVDAEIAAHPAFRVAVSGNPQGAPIILIPGLASSGKVWDGTVAHYCGTRQCHVLTLAGFAGIPAIAEPLLPAAERQLSEYISSHKLNRPVVIGHSMGGFLALKLAANHPDQVGRLVVVDAVPALAATQGAGMDAAGVKQAGEDMRNAMLAQDAASARASTEQAVRGMVTRPEEVDRVLAWGAKSDRATVINSMADMFGDDMREAVGRIRAPSLVLGSWIAYKAYVPKPMFEQTYRSQYARLHGVQVEVADSARHFIMLDDPAWMYDRIDHFLNRKRP